MPVEVVGPDNKTYQFPDGTDKDAAVAYFKKKGIGAQAPVKAPTLEPSFMERTGQRIKGNLDPAAMAKVGTEAATAIDRWLQSPPKPVHFTNPITNLQRAFGNVMPKVASKVGEALSQYKDPANIAGDVITGAITHTATTGKVPFEDAIKDLPKTIAERESRIAVELNTKALKPANMQKPTGEAVAKAKIWGSKRTLPTLIRQEINKNTARVQQAVQAADQSGVTIDVSKELDAAVDQARQRPAQLGDKKALADIAKWRDEISNPIDPKTNTPRARDWTKVKPLEALELTRGLEKSAGWEGSSAISIRKAAGDFRNAIGSKLDQASPGVAELRRQNSGLIEAEKSAKAIADRSLKEQITFAKHWLSAPNMSKLALSFVTIEMLKEAGMPYLGAAGAVIGLRAMGESMTSRTARAAIHQTIAEMMTGQRAPVARRAAGGPKMGSGPSITPQAPISPPSAPSGPQVQQTKALTGQAAPSAQNTGIPNSIPTPPEGFQGVWNPNDPMLEHKLQAEYAGEANTPSGKIQAFRITDPPYSFERAVKVLESPESGSLGRKLTPSEVEVLSNVKSWKEFDELESQWFKAEKTSPKIDVMADTAAKLQEKIDFAKHPAERAAAKKNLDQLHQAIAAGDDATQKAIARKLKVAGYQATSRAKGIAEATPAKSTGTSVEPTAPGLSPEEMAISLEDGYQKLQALGKIKVTFGNISQEIDAAKMAKVLQKDAALKRLGPDEELAAINEVLDKLKGGVKAEPTQTTGFTYPKTGSEISIGGRQVVVLRSWASAEGEPFAFVKDKVTGTTDTVSLKGGTK